LLVNKNSVISQVKTVPVMFLQKQFPPLKTY